MHDFCLCSLFFPLHLWPGGALQCTRSDSGRQAAWLPESVQEAAAAGERPGRRCRLAPTEVLPSQEGETFASTGLGLRIKKKLQK